MKRPISERMKEAKVAMRSGGVRLRTPRVFFLNPADYAEFMASDPPPPLTEYATYVGGHPVQLELPAFDGTAVRPSQAKCKKPISILYSYAGTTRKLRDA